MKIHSAPTRRILATSVSGLLVALAFTTVSRADSTWNGGTSTDWNNAANWTGGYPTNINAVINPGTVNIATISANAVTVNDILVNTTNTGTARVNQTAGTITEGGMADGSASPRLREAREFTT